MKKLIYVVVLSLIVLLCNACSNEQALHFEKSDIAMDTAVTLSADGPKAQQAVEESLQKLHELDEMASTEIATSDVARVNQAAGKDYVQVHPEIYKMVETSIAYSKKSNGVWDITVGPLIQLWGIGTDHARLPSQGEIAAKLALVGYKKIILRPADHSIMLRDPGMSIDLGGVAKGFASDEVLKIYKKYDIKNGLINLGASSLYAVGKNRKGQPWAIGLKHPRSDKDNDYLGIVKISDEALSTSGDYERFFIENGKRYHHILDPKTGYPADNGVMSDTVVINGSEPDNGMLSDIITTVLFVLGPQKGIEFLNNEPHISGEITGTDNKIYTADGFREKLFDLNKDFTFGN
jgi:thiamine biosynthesis lipoprotein